jgi:hypothetical protein
MSDRNKAYDGGPLDRRLHQHGMELIALYKIRRRGHIGRMGAVCVATADRRDRSAWLQNFRRTIARSD